MKFLSPFCSILLTPLLVALPLAAQWPSAPGAPVEAVSPAVLQLRVIDSGAKTSLAGSQAAAGVTVEVTDASGAPVSNAAVVFRSPDSGPSASFADGTHAALAYTDIAGRATAGNIRWSDTPGSVTLRITAAKNTAHAGIILEQTVIQPAATPVAPALVSNQPEPIRAQPVSAPPPARPHVSVLSTARPATPGMPSERVSQTINPDQRASLSAAAEDDSPDANVPVRDRLTTGASAIEEAPSVSVTSAGPASSGHSKKKWLIALAAAAGAGTALALMHKGGSASSSSGISFGSPTVSVGHP